VHFRPDEFALPLLQECAVRPTRAHMTHATIVTRFAALTFKTGEARIGLCALAKIGQLLDSEDIVMRKPTFALLACGQVIMVTWRRLVCV